MTDARFAELLQQGAGKLVEAQAELQAAVDDVTLHFVAPNEPPSVANVIQQSNLLSIIHMLSQIVRSPGRVPEPTLSDDLIKLMQTRVQHGTADLTIKGFRVGQEAAWRVWMKIAFTLSDDPAEIHGLLDRSSALLGAYIEKTIELANSHIEQFRTDLASGTPTSHRGLITAILDGQNIDPISASRRFAYPLTGQHHAMVVWNDDLSAEQGRLDRFMQEFAECTDVGVTLSLQDGSTTLWVWFSGTCPGQLEALLNRSGLRATLGTRHSGLDGFATSHREALAAQSIAKPSQNQQTLLSYENARLPIIMLKDKGAFERFSKEVLGDILSADPIYRSTLRLYLSHSCNLVQTAEALGIHRNTLQKRLERANDLLPEPLNPENRLPIGAALDGIMCL